MVLRAIVTALLAFLESDAERPPLHVDTPPGNLLVRIARWSEAMLKHFTPNETQFDELRAVVIGCLDQLLADHTRRAKACRPYAASYCL